MLGTSFVIRLAHLGWGFAPSVSALGLKTSFDHDNSPISVHRTYDTAVAAFPRVRSMLFQPMRMPDDSWNRRGLNIPLKRAFEVFVPNVCAIDMDTTGTWPFGRRLEDQVATRFLAMFLDMEADSTAEVHIETLQNQAALDTLPLEPKTPPNPLKNDKDFLPRFPYLADPWPSPAYVPSSLAGCILAVAAATWLAPDLEDRPIRPSDFDSEVRALDQDIDTIAAPARQSMAPEQALRLAHGLYRRGTLTQRSSDFDRVHAVLDGLNRDLGADPDVLLFRATSTCASTGSARRAPRSRIPASRRRRRSAVHCRRYRRAAGSLRSGATHVRARGGGPPHVAGACKARLSRGPARG